MQLYIFLYLISILSNNSCLEKSVPESNRTSSLNRDYSGCRGIEHGIHDSIISNIDCSAGGKRAGESGEKVWCWSTIEIPKYTSKSGVELSNGELFVDSECYENQVTIEGEQIKFSVSPKEPYVGDWCSNNYNLRAEVRTAPWNVRHPIGTEEWFGWSYTFGDHYEIDKYNQWMFFQVHGGIVGENPLISLQVNAQNFKRALPGEIYVVNASNNPGPNIYTPTGVFPKANQKLDIVIHVVWGGEEEGLLEVWIDNKLVCDNKGRTVFSFDPVGGNAKWGIYKWPWRDKNRVEQSLGQGISRLETYMGTLRMITRKAEDKDYGLDAYHLVLPD